VGLAEPNTTPGRGRGVLCVPEAYWLRWSGDVLEIGGRGGLLRSLPVTAAELTLVGRVLGPLAQRPEDGRRLAVVARFAHGATILIERRGARTAVAASPPPRSAG